jgi:hypothetical protein
MNCVSLVNYVKDEYVCNWAYWSLPHYFRALYPLPQNIPCIGPNNYAQEYICYSLIIPLEADISRKSISFCVIFSFIASLFSLLYILPLKFFLFLHLLSFHNFIINEKITINFDDFGVDFHIGNTQITPLTNIYICKGLFCDLHHVDF